VPAIQTRDLTVRYGTLVAVNRVSLEVPEGAIFGLVGPNGAGKTTALRVLAGLHIPDEGEVRVAGCNVVADRDRVRARIGYMADFFGVYDYLTVEEYLAFFGGMYGLRGPALEARIGAMLDTVNLTPKRRAFVKHLSRGMKQRLYCARALVHDPPILILDEPAAGIDPRGRAELVETLQKVHRQGKTIIISSHILEELQSLCTVVGIMEAGRLVGTRALRPEAAAGETRTVVLRVASEDAAPALAALQADAAVRSARAAAGGILVETANTDDAVSGIVRRLVERGIRVLLPRADAADLKEIFLKLTKGELM
jgi:ABC-2 type transport system ATP-binding protein